jgi:hypothetical protein
MTESHEREESVSWVDYWELPVFALQHCGA